MLVEKIAMDDIEELNRLKDIVNEYDIISDRYVVAINNICNILNKANEFSDGAKVIVDI